MDTHRLSGPQADIWRLVVIQLSGVGRMKAGGVKRLVLSNSSGSTRPSRSSSQEARLTLLSLGVLGHLPLLLSPPGPLGQSLYCATARPWKLTQALDGRPVPQPILEGRHSQAHLLHLFYRLPLGHQYPHGSVDRK